MDRKQVVRTLGLLLGEAWDRGFRPVAIETQNTEVHAAVITEEAHLISAGPRSAVWLTAFGPVEIHYTRRGYACQWCGSPRQGRSTICPNCGGPL